MGLPNLSKTVLRFAQTISKRTVTQSVVNHQPVKSYVDTPFKATITTPQSEDLQQVEVDTALRYKLCNSVDPIVIDDIFVHKTIEYKVIKASDREDYGYYRVLGEEIQN